MKAAAADGVPKAEAARRALRSLPAQVPASSPLGTRLYGGSCSSSSLARPVEPLGTVGLRSVAAAYRPAGKAPLALALQRAAQDLPARGTRAIVLLAAGGDDCARPQGQASCEAAHRLAARDPGLRIEVIGLGVDPAARRELGCVAREGRGVYADATGSADLTAALGAAASRALRDRRPEGGAVSGSADPATAAPLPPGLHVDSIAPGEERWYRLEAGAGEEALAAATVIGPARAQLEAVGSSFSAQLMNGGTAAFDQIPSLFAFGNALPSVGVRGVPGSHLLRVQLRDDSAGTIQKGTGGRALALELASGAGNPVALAAPRRTKSGAAEASDGVTVVLIAGCALLGALAGLAIGLRRRRS